MREQYIGLLVFFIILSMICLVRSFFKQGRLVWCLRGLLISIILPLFGNILINAGAGRSLCGFGYHVYLLGTTWIFYWGILFLMEYCGFSRHAGSLRKLALILTSVDTISLLLNPVFKHVFELEEVMLEEDGGTYYVLRSLTGHYAHLIENYLLFFVMVIIVLHKIIVVPKIYVERYVVIFMSMIITVLWETYYIVSTTPVDRSMAGYGLCGVLVYYFSMEYTPIFVVRQMLIQVGREISEAVFFFDLDGECVFVNESAGRMFDITDKNRGEAPALIGEMIGEANLGKQESFSVKAIRRTEQGSRNYVIEFHRVENKRGKYISGFYFVRDNTEEVAEQNRRQYYATHDRLTGLFNREHFIELVQDRLAKDPDGHYYMMSSNITNFKLVNDIYGREKGDEILNLLARGIADLAHDDTIYCRLHNDKFALLIRKEDFIEERFLTEPGRVVRIKEDMRYPVSVHMGIYDIPDNTMSIPAMLDRTYMAIDKIKDNFGTAISYYDDSLREERIWEQQVSGSIEGAIEGGQIVPYLQPQADSDGVCHGAEILVRWIHPEHGFLSPARFIPIIEKNGLIARVDKHMWEQACILLNKWSGMGADDINLSVNISPKDFFFMDIYEVLIGLVEKYGISHDRLHLEITETALMDNRKLCMETIDKLRLAGFVVEMDDFGSGYSSLNMLKDMPLDVLKVDMGFLNKTNEKEKAETILRMIMELSDRLGIKALTEGVETKEQLDMLNEMGCHFYQGYYFAKPMPVEEFEKLYIIKGK